MFIWIMIIWIGNVYLNNVFFFFFFNADYKLIMYKWTVQFSITGLIVGMVVVKMGACSRPTESALLDETSADSTSLPNDSLNLPQDQPRQTT